MYSFSIVIAIGIIWGAVYPFSKACSASAVFWKSVRLLEPTL